MEKKNKKRLEDVRKTSSKNRLTAMMLCWFLGFFGVHRLYAGKLGSGFLMMYGTIVSLLLLPSTPLWICGPMCLPGTSRGWSSGPWHCAR